MRYSTSKSIINPIKRAFSTSLPKLWLNSSTKFNLSDNDLPIDLSEEVKHALAKNQAIVALESTLITHGTLSYLLLPAHTSTQSFEE